MDVKVTRYLDDWALMGLVNGSLTIQYDIKLITIIALTNDVLVLFDVFNSNRSHQGHISFF